MTSLASDDTVSQRLERVGVRVRLHHQKKSIKTQDIQFIPTFKMKQNIYFPLIRGTAAETNKVLFFFKNAFLRGFTETQIQTHKVSIGKVFKGTRDYRMRQSTALFKMSI